MRTTDAFTAAARAYADGVWALFAPSGAPAGERGGRGATSYAELAARAEKLSPLSVELTQATATQLNSAEPTLRVQASTRLLAKALTDLEVSAFLLQAAMNEEDEVDWTGSQGVERSLASTGTIEERLRILLGEVEASPETAERAAGTVPSDIPAARSALSLSIEDALLLILERASQTGQSALTALLGLGVSEVANAVGVIGMDVAQVLGQAEGVTRLYHLCRDFAVEAYDSIVALLGQQLAQTAAEQVSEWLDELREGRPFGELLEKLYETGQTGQQLSQLIISSQADLERFTVAIKDVERLEADYRQQVNLADKLLKAFKYLGLVSVAALPHCGLLVAAAYILLGAYVVFAGADYVDARRLRQLDRVPGVPRVVEVALSSV